MITTIVVQHREGVRSGSDTHHSRDSNGAGAPLPIVPRRPSRSHSVPSCLSPPQSSISATCSHWAQTTDESDSNSSASENPRTTIKPRRRKIRGVRSGALSPPRTNLLLSPPKKHIAPSLPSCQPLAKPGKLTIKQENDASPIVAPRPLMYVPGMLRLSVETIRSHMLADSHLHDPRKASGSGHKSAPPTSGINEGPRPIRKKSGQPVKSSLKPSRSSTRGSLSVITTGYSTKSEPATPMHKAVHFDTKLEHVKLFLAEQKPLAVSRDGSPTDDTSGTDSDFPSFIYGPDEEQRPRKKLVMRPMNMPAKPKLDADVALEDFYLNFDGTNILGKVRVCNLAYAKSVVVRFTFDSWQTTSEVTGRYAESITPQFDRFSFSIRLNDMLARIEGKTFIMAIRYSFNGREVWDNNDHQNYVATFTKTKMARETKRSDDEDASDLESLRDKLEQVMLRGKESNGRPLLPAQKRLTAVQSNETDPPCFKSGVSLASRYDFATSLRYPSAWKPSNSPTWHDFPQSHSRSLSYPQRLSANPTLPLLPQCSVPWPEKGYPNKRSVLPVASSFQNRPLLGSPRDVDTDRVSRASFAKVVDDTNDVSSPFSARNGSHHQRCFETRSMDSDGSVKKMPPETPPVESRPSPASPAWPSSRYYSFPPLRTNGSALSSSLSSSTRSDEQKAFSPPTFFSDLCQGVGSGSGESSGESELSTPSPATPRSETPSPMDPFMNAMLPPVENSESNSDTGLGLIGGISRLPSVSTGTHYRHFLNKFCFFTGSPNGREIADITMSAVHDPITGPGSPHDLSLREPLHQASDGSDSVSGGVSTLKISESQDDVDDSGESTSTIDKWGLRSATPVPL